MQQKATIGRQPILWSKRFIELVLIKKYLVTWAKQDDYEFNKNAINGTLENNQNIMIR